MEGLRGWRQCHGIADEVADEVKRVQLQLPPARFQAAAAVRAWNAESWFRGLGFRVYGFRVWGFEV